MLNKNTLGVKNPTYVQPKALIQEVTYQIKDVSDYLNDIQ